MIQEANLDWRYFDTESNLLFPWYTLPTLQWLKEHQKDISTWKVLENGAGYSTCWWRANCRELLSIESNEKWAKAMNACFYQEVFDQSNQEFKDKLWDCIIIDGIEREKNLALSINYLRSGGILIVDNWDSEDFNPTLVQDLIKDWPIQIFKQPNHRTWQTAILTKP